MSDLDDEEVEATRRNREKKCKYCKGKEDISNKVFEDGTNFSDYFVRVAIEKQFEKEVLIVSPVEYRNGKREQYMNYIFLINYCPMCRKKVGVVWLKVN